MCVKLPQMNACTKLVSDRKILETYSEIWNKIKSLIKKEFHSEPVYNNKYIKTKNKLQ